MSKHMLEDPNDNYMTFEEIQLKMPLKSVKQADDKNSTLVIPENFVNIITRFFDVEDIAYTIVEDPVPYPKEKLASGLKAYEDCSPVFKHEEPVLLITPFDPESLFTWSKQLFGEHKDPSYQQYLDDQRRASEDYYWKYVAE